ncbi:MULTISPECIES: sensor histidine kinase [unclassified Pseudomonas]|uniref:sensor histidine kinase n=1 Tax=unclassified Pseudomonas TaxID=196821 RepID=UPI000C86CDD8|nr:MULTISPECIES: sensor histidine kinase [unclassified Pseudomonas]PMV86618.1 two-component sensor histidine kinase [Pseudomonas sp. FW306-2-2C-B10A]PMV90293.1 two-component sensor histidine kinase [Pseudomonas sp. GW101-1A09]PMV94766.1 two-component sensor histidine kinase [Pseudomonas sp. GW460-C8]PMW07181.1 two-component sensor histidine kinase [Pseudomonas sp. MPR-TSA4]PMW08657.1 two-component sensor histidine kinase [Pseudomonas sp. FW306-2-1A-C05A]
MKWSDLPGRHSLFWKLACLLVAFCLLMIWLSWSWGRYMEQRNQFLSDQARVTLTGYAAEAEQAWRSEQSAGVDAWLQGMKQRETGWVGVISGDLQSLSSQPLTDQEIERLTFLRGLDWPIHKKRLPWLRVPFPGDSTAGSLVIELPQRFMPGQYRLFWRVITNGIIPGLFTLLLCVGLYRLLVVPLNQLREQANAWRADQLNVRLSSSTTKRSDELGELGRAFDHMAERLQSTVALQQQLLRDLSHELRTPLSRLRVASESEQGLAQLRERIGREVDGMQRLVEDTLQLAWLDTERAPLPDEAIQVQALWEMLTENACYESTWPASQLQCAVDSSCWVRGNLNTLAQALENILRNAIRHSPSGGIVRFSGQRDGDFWHLWLEDEGGGVAEADLERIFCPFIRLDGSRPGDGGFGLGLSIARNAVKRQGGSLWAQNTGRGLRLNIRLVAESDGVSDDAIASRLAPTVDLCRPQIV